MKNLTQIGTEYGTDKVSLGYTDIYEKYFATLRQKKINILEIGAGVSQLMWNDYFPNAKIFCIDRKDDNFSENTYNEICDQTNKAQLKKVFKDVKFDIIIDDGGHRINEQMTSFGVLFNRLNSKGLYIIEDLHTSHREGHRLRFPFEASSLYSLERYNEVGVFDSQFLTKTEIQYLNKNIHSIDIHTNNRGRNILRNPIVAIISKK
jgi:trans-aconitate methyltransferase